MEEGQMRRTNYLIVRGEASEIDKLVDRIEADGRDGGWKRDSTAGPGLTPNGGGRPEHYLYHWSGGEGRPAAGLLISKVGPGRLSVFIMLPKELKPLTTEEFNRILADFAESVLRPLTVGLSVRMSIIPPLEDSLANSLSPDAFRKLIRFSSMASDRPDLTVEDHERWDEFWSQVYTDGSLVEDEKLLDWLAEKGLSKGQVSTLISRNGVGQTAISNGSS